MVRDRGKVPKGITSAVVRNRLPLAIDDHLSLGFVDRALWESRGRHFILHSRGVAANYPSLLSWGGIELVL